MFLLYVGKVEERVGICRRNIMIPTCIVHTEIEEVYLIPDLFD